MSDATQPIPASAFGSATPIASHTDLSGRTLGDFRILRCLGQGGMGKVYLAEQISLKRKVALKFLRADHAANETALRRFRAEAEAVARVTHANIVQVYAIGEVDGLNYMALEYVEGRNLREYLGRKGLPDLPVALSVMRQVASALQKASESGIVHRDIKPENILLTRKGEVKVADFGLSRIFVGDQDVHLTQTGMTLGTPLYMSPEQVQGKPLDPRSDIYSFGVTCYHMLSGQPPYKGATAFDVAIQHVQNEPPPLPQLRPDLPVELCALVRRMMSKDPAARPQTGREVLRELTQMRDDTSATGTIRPPSSTAVRNFADATPPESISLAPTAPLWRRRTIVAVSVSLGFALIAGVGLRLWANARTPPTDGGITEDHPNLQLANDREHQLVAAVALYARPDRPDRIRQGGSHHVELGTLYLEQKRYDEAEKFFQDMVDREKSPEQYKKIGNLGLAITFAMQDDYEKSIKLFMAQRDANARGQAPRGIGPPPVLPPEDIVNMRYWMLTALDRDAVHTTLPAALQRLRDLYRVPWVPNANAKANGKAKGKGG